jgi:hypothetical protein
VAINTAKTLSHKSESVQQSQIGSYEQKRHKKKKNRTSAYPVTHNDHRQGIPKAGSATI